MSKLELDKLKSERAKAQAQLHLNPKGPDAAYVRSAIEAERERKIASQEMQLSRWQGRSRSDFDGASKVQIRGPMHGPSR